MTDQIADTRPPTRVDWRGEVEVVSGYLEIALAELEAWANDHKAPWDDPHHGQVQEAVERMKAASGLLMGLYAEVVEAQRSEVALRARVQHLTEALGSLVTKLDVVHRSPEFQGAMVMAHIHGVDYQGPNYATELDAARAALTPPASTEGRNG